MGVLISYSMLYVMSLQPHGVLNARSGAEGRSVKKTVRWTVFSGVHEGLCPRAGAGSNTRHRISIYKGLQILIFYSANF